jgi:hypothetical protein
MLIVGAHGALGIAAEARKAAGAGGLQRRAGMAGALVYDTPVPGPSLRPP